MLTDLILHASLTALTTVLGFFSWNAPALFDVTGAQQTIGNAAALGNAVVPMSTMINCVIAGLAFDLTVTGVQTFLWLYRLLPFKFS